MSKKRVTKNNSKLESNVLDEFQYDESQIKKQIQQPPKPLNQQKNNTRKNKKNKPPSLVQPILQHVNSQGNPQFIQQSNQSALNNSRNQSSVQSINPPNSNNISTQLNIKKKKVSNKQQNQGLRIIKEKQTQRIFQHLCNPEGNITVESLGRILVRAKKEFQVQDVQNMIRYFNTIERKMKTSEQNQTNSNTNSRFSQPNKSILNYKHKKLLSKSIQFNQSDDQNKLNKRKPNKMRSQQNSSYISEQQQNYEDNLDQSDQQQFFQEQDKTLITFQQFKIIKEYFQR